MQIMSAWSLTVMTQYSEINSLTNDTGLKLNISKLEVIQLSQRPMKPLEIIIGDVSTTTKKSALEFSGTRQSNLSPLILPKQEEPSLVSVELNPFTETSTLSPAQVSLKFSSLWL